MNIREISDIFKDTADNITAIKSYNFGWASDRVRQGNTEDYQELNEFPRVFFAVPTITGSDQTRKQDIYQVTLFFDDLLGYDNEGEEDPTLQIDKWANLQQYANYFVQRLNKIKQSILPNYLFIPEAPSITFDSFTGIQRMITVQLSFNLVVPTNCDPGIITLVQCIANIVTSSNLTASLTTVLKFAASLEGRATLTADINFVQKVASSLNANASLVSDINFVQKVQASLLTSANVTGDISIPKLLNASLLATGTTTADLTVGGAFDADAQAFISAANITDTVQKNAINSLVIALKGFGIWTKMIAIYPMVGGVESSHKYNLKDPRDLDIANRLTFSSGWTHSNNGAKPNGTSAFANTFLNPSTNFNTTTFNHLSYYSRTTAAATTLDYVLGVGRNTPTVNIHGLVIRRSADQSFIVSDYPTSILFRNSGGNTGSGAGFFVGTQQGINLKLFRNNSLLSSNSQSIISSSLINKNMLLGASDIENVIGNYTNRECALASIGTSLTDSDVNNFYTAVQAFQTTLNRQV